MKKSRLVTIFAAIVLLVGIGSTIFVNASLNNSQEVNVGGKAYSINELFEIAETRTLAGETGIALDSLIIQTGTADPENSLYTIIAADGYQKTVSWENMKNGIMTKARESVFSDLPKAYGIKEIIEIKVEK